MLGIFCKDAKGEQTQPHQLVLWTSLPMACGRGAHLRSVWTGRLKLRTEDQRTERGHIREHKRGILFRSSVCVVVGGKRQDSVQAGWQVCWCEMGMTTTQTMCPSEPALHSELRRAGGRPGGRRASTLGGLLVALPQEASRSVPVSVLIGLAVRRATGELASSTVSSAVLFLLNPGREVLRKATLVNAEPCIRSWSATLRRVCSAVAESDCSIGSSRDFGEVGDRDVCGLLAPAELSCDSLPPSVPGHAASEAPCRNSSTGPRHFLGLVSWLRGPTCCIPTFLQPHIVPRGRKLAILIVALETSQASKKQTGQCRTKGHLTRTQ